MNIFLLEYNQNDDFKIDWEKSPESYDRLRLNKMILEYAQLLSTACNVLSGGKQISPYKTTHVNHPCSIWCRESKENFERLLSLAIKTCETYTKREYRHHKSEDVIIKLKNLYKAITFPNVGYTRPHLAMPPQYKSDDIVEAYRKYWVDKPKMVYYPSYIPHWFEKNRVMPYQIKTDLGIITVHKG